MDRIAGPVFVCLAVLMPATSGVLHAAGPPPSATRESPADAPNDITRSISDDAADKSAARQNLLIIGASSLTSPVAQTELVVAMLESQNIPMHVEGRFPELNTVREMLGSTRVWDYVVIDAWHLGRASADGSEGNASVPPDFPKAVAVFVNEVRAHSPQCKIILFPWWIPRGPTATRESVMKVFDRCVQEARANNIWVATTGPAFMEARLERLDLHITASKTDAHPGNHGAYLNACSLFSMIAGKSPVGLPASLKISGDGDKNERFTIAPDDARVLQELAWKVYQREIAKTKLGKPRNS